MMTAVITTIQSPTPSVRTLAKYLAACGGKLVIAGDVKGPQSFYLDEVPEFPSKDLCFLDMPAQLASGFQLAENLPTKHYARKNLGYLQAIAQGASCIYETDDDNAPLESWQVREEYLDMVRVVHADRTDAPRWVNVYRLFTDELIWPRGLPLDQIHSKESEITVPPSMITDQGIWAPIQQGLADGAPDVDAIWRLVLDREFRFAQGASVLLPSHQWCPFNTQSTWWWPVVYPLLYVPSYCSFRMCDIWKSFVAQRCVWELGTGIVFHAAEVWQERNVHNLMRDFKDEIPGYSENHRLAGVLEQTTLSAGPEHVGANLRSCYEALVGASLFPEKELALVDAWLSDLSKLTKSN